jgi:hypothetical protein
MKELTKKKFIDKPCPQHKEPKKKPSGKSVVRCSICAWFHLPRPGWEATHVKLGIFEQRPLYKNVKRGRLENID